MIKKLKILRLSTALAIIASSALLSSSAETTQFDNSGQATITNEILYQELTFTKRFDDSNNQYNVRPSFTDTKAIEFFNDTSSDMQFKIECSPSNQESWSALTFSEGDPTATDKTHFSIKDFDKNGNNGNDWTWTIKVPYKDQSGNVLKYSISESTTPNGYTSSNPTTTP